MRKKIIILLMCTLFSGAVTAKSINYSDLIKPNAESLPYGESISIKGNLSDLEKDDVNLGDWITLKKLVVVSKVGSRETKESVAKVDTETGQWEVIIEPLPKSGSIEFSFHITGTISNKAIKGIAEKLQKDTTYIKILKEFKNNATGKSPQETEKIALESYSAMSDLVKTFIPNLFVVKETEKKETGTKEFVDIIGALSNIEKNLKDISSLPTEPFKDISSIKKALEFLQDEKIVQEAIEKLHPADQKSIKQIIEDFKSNYQAYLEFVSSFIESEIAVNVELSSTLTTSALVEDLLRYAGVDIAAIYVNDLEEFRKFMLVNIYWGPVEDTPVDNFSASRVSFTLGWDLGDLSNNSNSDIKGDNAFVVGLGYRLNKYFRVSMGNMFYRSQSNEKLKDEAFIGISVDITAFEALQGLVSK